MLRGPDHILTPRLLLRAFRTDDAEAIFSRYAADPAATRYVGFRTHRSPEDVRGFLQLVAESRAKGRGYAFAVTLPGAGLIGSIGCDVKQATVTVGYLLARPWWGRGLASEALQALVGWARVQPGVWRVDALCHPDNLASIRVLEKAGLQREALLRRAAAFPNLGEEPQDCLVFALVRQAAQVSPSSRASRRNPSSAAS